ncbi:MAG: hypothetical protein ACKPFH_01235 [Dolichospermum sp.]
MLVVILVVNLFGQILNVRVNFTCQRVVQAVRVRVNHLLCVGLSYLLQEILMHIKQLFE